MAKAPDGQGAIRKMANGRWRLVLFVGWKVVDGERKRDERTWYGATRKEVITKRDEFRDQVKAGHRPTADLERQTVAEFVENKWLPMGQVSPSHQRTRERVMRARVLPAIGALRLRQVQPADVARIVNPLKATHPRSALEVYRQLHKMYADALRSGDALRNVLDALDPPEYRSPEVHPPSGADVRALIEKNRDARWVALFALAASTGLRPSELVGLEWRDVRWEQGRIEVQRTRATNRAPVPGPTKTDRSVRPVPLTPTVAALLRAHQDRQRFERERAGNRWEEHGLVFASQLGRPVWWRNVQRAFKVACKNAGLPGTIRPYDLRHFFVSELLDSDLSLHDVADLAGHHSPAMTDKVYRHRRRSATEAASNALEAILHERGEHHAASAGSSPSD